MIVEIGHYALLLALALSVGQSAFGLWGGMARDRTLMAVAPSAAMGSFVLVALAFAALAYGYLTSDFSVQNVFENSHTAKPVIYKLTGLWGNHEGSMLLWTLILTLFAALVAVMGRGLPVVLRANVLGVQGVIAVLFLLFLVLTSNPFARLSPAPFEGRDLNPVLQDPGLAIHPPLLYIGYVGFSIAFSFAAAALIEGRIDAVWARAVRPWTLTAWIFLTLGIAMGSYWAYYELGWGGWWFWDPVENASLMPWLAGTALVHSAIVMEKREALKVWTVLLAILTFSLSLIGTFLVRSGVLTSVHAFATDPERGVFILGILCLTIGGSLALFALRSGALRQGGLFAPISREGGLVLNNLFLSSACAAVLVGTLYPLGLEALTGEKISVGPPFFNATFGPLVLPLLLLIPLGQTMAWKRGDLLAAAQRLAFALGLSILAVVALLAALQGGPVAAPLGMGIAVWLILGSISEIALRVWKRGQGLSVTWSRARGLPTAAWGSALAHAGVGVTLLGIAAAGLGDERIATMGPGSLVEVGGYGIRLERITPRSGTNYREDVGLFTILSGERVIGSVESAKRVYTARGMPTTEAGLHTRGVSQVYISIGEVADGSASVRVYHKPLVLLIWLGAVVMAAGGMLSLADRRHRVGVPARARRAPAPAGASATPA